MAADLIESFRGLALADPARIAVIEVDRGRVVGRGAILAEAERIAGLLDRTVSPSGVVLLRGPGGAGFWAGLLAVLGTGRSLLPLAPDAPPGEDVALASAHGIETILDTDPAGSDGPSMTGPPIERVEPVERDLEGGHDADSEGGPELERWRDSTRLDRGDRGRLLLRSSGTTGRPGVAVREAAAVDRVSAVLVDLLGLVPSDRVLCTIPMSHAYGIEHGVLAPMRAGASVAFKAGFDLMAGAKALLEGTTVFPAVPVTLEAATRVGRRDTTLRLAYTAGSPLPDAVRDDFEACWGVRVGDLYGMTEIGTIGWGFGDERRPVTGVSIGVVDPDATEEDAMVACHGTGEIVVRSDAMFAGYVSAAGPSGSRPAIDPGRRVDGHLRTGDLGRIEADGRVRITGRTKLQFDVGGLKVNPEEVEAVLATIPHVSEVAVLPLRLSGTVVRAQAVVVPDGVSTVDPTSLEAAVRACARDRLPPHQRPRVVRIVEALPRSPTGKLLRGRLLAEFSAPDE